jgi:hypothetical protein
VTNSRPFAQALLDAMDGITYVLDRDGVILQCCSGANEPLPSDPAHAGDLIVRGRCVYDSIQGEPVKAIYRRLNDMVWSRRRPKLSFYFRCDTPGLERLMRMSLGLILRDGEPGGVLYQSVPVHEVPRLPLPLFDNLFVPRAPRSEQGRQVVVLCAFCLNIGWPPAAGAAPQEWIDAADYYRRGGLSDVTISHGVCEPCAARVLAGADDPSPFTQPSYDGNPHAMRPG